MTWFEVIMGRTVTTPADIQSECLMPTVAEQVTTPLDARTIARSLALRHGYNSNDFLALYDGWHYFVTDSPPGAVMYVERGRTLVACGEPIAAAADLPAVLSAFTAHAASRHRRIAFLGAGERLATIAVGCGFGALKVGEEPFFDLATYAPRGDRAKKVRSAANQARRNGVVTRLYRPQDGIDAELETRAAMLCRTWRDTRPAGDMAFGLTLEPFTGRDVKRYIVAEQEGKLVGFLACSPIPARCGYYLEDVIRAPDAPNGATELLVLAALDALRSEGASVATLGVAPLAGVERQPYGRHAALARVLCLTRDHLNGAYHFASLNHYKRKYAPSSWEDSYLLYQPARLTPALAWSLLSAFTPESPIASLRETVQRRVRRTSRLGARLPALKHPFAALLFALVVVMGLFAARTRVDDLPLSPPQFHLWWLAILLLISVPLALAGRRLQHRT